MANPIFLLQTILPRILLYLYPVSWTQEYSSSGIAEWYGMGIFKFEKMLNYFLELFLPISLYLAVIMSFHWLISFLTPGSVRCFYFFQSGTSFILHLSD